MDSDPCQESTNSLKCAPCCARNELTAVVDQMEAEWRERAMLSEESARELHAVLAQAGGLFGGPVETLPVENTPQRN